MIIRISFPGFMEDFLFSNLFNPVEHDGEKVWRKGEWEEYR